MHARAFEDQLTQSLNVVDLMLQNVLTAESIDMAPPLIGVHFQHELRRMPLLRSLSLLDEQGRTVASSNPRNVGLSIAVDGYLPPAPDAADFSSFLRIGTPWSGRDFADGYPISAQRPAKEKAQSLIPVIRRIALNDRRMILLAAVNPDYFVNLYAQKLKSEQGVAEVLRYDGTLLLTTGDKDLPGALHLSNTFKKAFSDTAFNAYEDETGDDGNPALSALRTSRLFPLIVITHIHREHALQSWRMERQRLLWVVVPALLAVLLVSTLIYRRERRITRRLAQAQLEERQHMAALINTLPINLLMLDSTGHVVMVNAAWKRFLAFANQSMVTDGVGQSYLKLCACFHTDCASPDNPLAQGIESVLKHQSQPFEHDYQLNMLDGPRWFHLTAHPLHTLGLRGAVVMQRDITARRQADAQLRQATQEAQAANLAKSRFLATMSHEIRTPMNGILGMTQLLMSPQLPDGERLDYARTVLNSGQSLLSLLNDILDLSKIESGKFQLDSTVVDANQLLHEMQALFSGAAKNKALPLDAQWHGAPGQCYQTDGHRVRQMLSNLVGNAIKFTTQGSIQMEGRELARDGDSALLEFAVVDTGIGIPDDKLGLLFKPFSQTDASTTREFGGTGLGLSIVSSLAKLLGGEVGVQSEVGQGSRFWFQVRAKLVQASQDLCKPGGAPLESSSATRASAPTEANGRLTGRILVAEDVPLNQLVVKGLLQQLGLQVSLVSDGQQALDMICTGTPPDAVLMDLHMPVMDGCTATQRIRAWESANGRPRTPIIALTADAFDTCREQCMSVGMQDFLTKPITKEALRRSLSQWLPAASPSAKPIDQAPLAALVAELTPLVLENKFDALARAKVLLAMLTNTELATPAAALLAALEVFDFSLALQHLQAIGRATTIKASTTPLLPKSTS